MSKRPGAVPQPLDRIVGRAADIASVERALEMSRLVTITGLGGSGKTRLALEVAQRAQDRGMEALFVDLGPLDDAGLVPDVVAHALGRAEVSEVPAEARVLAVLESRPMLLILDNLEHLHACRPFLTRLLAGVGNVHVVATSRVPLGIPGEREYPVGGLAVPVGSSPADVAESPACTLFMTRAAEVGADLDVPLHAASIAALCRRLDGLPLAIELAARRTRALSPQAVLSRITAGENLLVDPGRATRQSSVDVVIAWSVGLLTERERRFFRCLGIFSGGFDLAAAERITADAQALDAVERLIELGLVRRIPGMADEERFTMLESIRLYLLRDPKGSDDLEAGRSRHLIYYHDLAEQMEAAQHDAAGSEWRRRLAGDVGNVRTALDHAVAIGNAQSAQELAAAMLPAWEGISRRVANVWRPRSPSTMPARRVARGRWLHCLRCCSTSRVRRPLAPAQRRPSRSQRISAIPACVSR